MDDELALLEKELDKLDRYYWIENNPLVPDREYDLRKKRYLELSNNKERQIGYEGSDREILPSPMYSLDNAFDESEYEKWINSIHKKIEDSITFIVEPKYDGISITLLYDKGILQKAFTRGNGTYGERIDDKLPPDIPKQIGMSGTIEIRGEIYVSYSNFKKLVGYKNPRQAAVGILRNSNKTNKEYLTFVCHGFGLGHDLFIKETDLFDTDLSEYFSMSPILYNGRSWRKAFEISDRICHNGVNDLKDIPKDGAVIKIDEIEARNTLGHTSHHPRWAMAIKTQSNEFESVINGAIWTLGTRGTLTPTLDIVPVDIDGVTVSRVTADNATRFNHANYAVGDKVWVKRSGDVIPKITRHEIIKHESREELKSPEKCPVCNAKTIFKGAYLFCSNGFMCDGQTKSRLQQFVSRDGLDLKGFGVAVIDWLVDDLNIKFGSELIEGFRSKIDRNLITEKFGKNGLKLIKVCEHKSWPLERVIYALSIPRVGLVSAKTLSPSVKNLIGLTDMFTGTTPPKIKNLDNSIIDSIYYWMSHPEVISEVIHLNCIIETTLDLKAIPSKGKVCFTGSGDGFDRMMLEQSATRIGYEISKTVTGKVDYLVTGKSGNSQKKIDDSIKKNIPILTVAEWIKKTT